MTQPRVQAFRDFAGQLAAQVTEQLCVEFEREISVIWNDVLMYRNELDRVAKLLGTQLEREKKLHGVIEEMIGHSTNVNNQAQFLAQQQPGSGHLHQVLEQVLGQHAELMNQTVAGVDQTTQVLSAHASNAHYMKQEAITAENEFVRIVNLLEQPLIPSTVPAPTKAAVPMNPLGTASAPGSVKYAPGPAAFSTPPPNGNLTPGLPMPMMPSSPSNGPPFGMMPGQAVRGPMPQGGPQPQGFAMQGGMPRR